MKRNARLLALLGLTSLVACGDDAKPAVKTPAVTPPASTKPIASSTDPLGPRPVVDAPAPFTPPTPVVYKRPNGLKVWLVERHALPIVSVEIVVRKGASSDPTGKEGVAMMTANMLDEGAGKRGALEIASDVDRLGATLHTGAYADYSYVQLTSLKKNLLAASAIMGDVVTKPTFAPAEWKRAHDLWSNDLQQRVSEPAAVANVVMLQKVFGQNRTYAAPTDGTTKSAKSVTLTDVKSAYDEGWHPDSATCVVVGDVTRAEVDAMLDASLASWKPSSGGSASTSSGIAKSVGRSWYVVDRPGAPQTMIVVGRKGVAAKDPSSSALVRVNNALGGSFTSRLNQDLREEHHWTYGASSRFSFNAEPGYFAASAAVETPHAGEALKAMLTDIETYAKDGPTDEEAEKTRLIARADLVEAFESVTGAAHRLARNAGVGLDAGHEAAASQRLYAATKADLKRLAAAQLGLDQAVIVLVGPKAEIEAQLVKQGFPKPMPIGPEGD